MARRDRRGQGLSQQSNAGGPRGRGCAQLHLGAGRRGRRSWKDNPDARDAVCRNRRRIRGARGKRLLRQRGERLKRPFAHLYETGRMRRVHLRGHVNILNRVLLHACALNLGLLMRASCGVGTPRSLQGRVLTLLAHVWSLVHRLERRWSAIRPFFRASPCRRRRAIRRSPTTPLSSSASAASRLRTGRLPRAAGGEC
jgi:hypothetical protein